MSAGKLPTNSICDVRSYTLTTVAGIIGAGVIGGGWAARFLLSGWDVKIFDPDPAAREKVQSILKNARRTMPSLSDEVIPREGNLTFHTNIGDTVAETDWIQESVPERLEVKQQTLEQIQSLSTGIIGSSSSGFTPSALQKLAVDPTRVVVTHPFNPVYLLPLVELVTNSVTGEEIIRRAKAVLRDVGMHVLHLTNEIDAHIADRLLEAVWREALWLIKDDIATTKEVDEAICFGFGLRWAQMGLFEIYRLAGGDQGMRHFLTQFGPTLKWPWSRLIDVPEFDQELIDKIVSQSEEQSGQATVREMEQIRDDNLVGILRGLKANGWGAGALLNRIDAEKRQRSALPTCLDDISDLIQPILVLDRIVPVDWVDYNGRMTEHRYLDAFSRATDYFLALIGCDDAYVSVGNSYFTVETHLRHLHEVLVGERIKVRTQVLFGQGKKLHLFHSMCRDDNLIAKGEHLLVHTSLSSRQSSLPSLPVQQNLAGVAAAHRKLPRPEGAGASVRLA